MKSTLFFFMIFCRVSIASFAQETDCDDLNKPLCCPDPADYIPEIPAPEDLKCKEEKSHLYAILPKLTTYNGYIYNEVGRCNKKNLDVYPGRLSMEYCIPNTRKKMSINIIDLDDPFYETEAGKMNKNILLMNVDPAAVSFFGGVKSNIRKFDINIIHSERFAPMGGDSETVSFFGYADKRFFLQIIVEDPEHVYKRPEEFESFIEKYVLQVHL